MHLITDPKPRPNDAAEHERELDELTRRGWMLYHCTQNGWHIWTHRSGVEVAAFSYDAALDLALKAKVT
jgi:hypothetical protein